MKRSQFSEEQNIAILKDQEARFRLLTFVVSMTWATPASANGKPSTAAWTRLKVLEDENSKLKRMLTDVMLGYVA